MDAVMVEQVRRFNRTVTQRVGALNDSYLSRARPLGQARLLWEISPVGSDVRLLRSRLDLDSGYLSRLLRSLERDGLIVVERSGTDGRVRTARLTSSGLAERAELDRRSDELATSVLGPLSAGQRARLVTAMAEVERLMVASAVQLTVRDPRDPAARSCLRAYFSELVQRFEHGFDPALGQPAGDAELSPPAGLLLVASLHEEPAGCGALIFHDETGRQGDHGMRRWAHIKRMWVAPDLRGLGLGRRILAGLEARAAAAGADTIRLDTNRVLTEAISLYRASGYREVPAFNHERYAHHWFEKTLDSAAPADEQR